MLFGSKASATFLAATLIFPLPPRAAVLPEGDVRTLPVRSSAPAGAPNVLVWMLDDVGFAQIACYGGLIETPNIDRVAHMGLRFSNYHTPSICSATRASFLTGRNSHSVHVGGHAAATLGFPGYDGLIPAAAGTVAENLRQQGYATFALGKWDHLPSTDVTPAGPFTYWPTKQGFDRFYGFLAADVDNWTPVLWNDNSPLTTPATTSYHLNTDLADQAIAMIGSRSSRSPLPPFFMYWATGTAHAPHHAPAAWIARYKGKFDAGWDVIRDTILQREIAEGSVPALTTLAPRPEVVPAWDSLSPDAKRLYARQMEVFAASISFADAQFGRILDALEKRGELDNTMIVVTSDNGASAEGARDGSHSEALFVSGHLADVSENLRWIDKWGGPETYPHYSFGWAVAGNTPFRYYKQTTHEGGVHVPLIVAWPKGVAARGEWRNQFVHASDIAPTILDAARVPRAAYVNGVPQSAFEGDTITYSFADADAPTRKKAQYFEMYGNRAIWSQGWKAVTSHRMQTWQMAPLGPPDEAWELYNLTNDPGETRDLAAENPAKVAELGRLFDEQARQFNVYPVGNISEARPYAAEIALAEFTRRGGKWAYPAPIARMGEAAAPPVMFRSYVMTANIGLASGSETGPIFAMGGAKGGIGFYLKAGRPVFVLRPLSGEAVAVAAMSKLHQGSNAIELSFTRKPAAPLAPSDVQITIKSDGHTLVTKTVSFAMPLTFSLAETFDVGRDDGSAVTADYASSTPFAGDIRDVAFDFNVPP